MADRSSSTDEAMTDGGIPARRGLIAGSVWLRARQHGPFLLLLPLAGGLAWHELHPRNAPVEAAVAADPTHVHKSSRIKDAADYVQDPAYNPGGVILSADQYSELEALVAALREELRLATKEMHGHAQEWARLRIQMGHAQRVDSIPSDDHASALEDRESIGSGARSPEDGAVVYITDSSGHFVVTVFPGEYAPFDVAVEDRKAVIRSSDQRLLDFFASL